MPHYLVDSIGILGGILTTACWLPQALKIIRSKETRALSLPANLAFTLGVFLWLIYGIAQRDWPLTLSSAVTAALTSVIVALKLRHG